MFVCLLQDAAAAVPSGVAAPDAVAAKAGDGDRGDVSELAQQVKTAPSSGSSEAAAAHVHQDSTACSSSSVPA